MNGMIEMHAHADVDLVMLFASGFGNAAYTTSDIRAYYRECRHLYPEHTTEHFYGTWNSKWKHTARRLSQVCTPDARTVFVGHS